MRGYSSCNTHQSPKWSGFRPSCPTLIVQLAFTSKGNALKATNPVDNSELRHNPERENSANKVELKVYLSIYKTFVA